MNNMKKKHPKYDREAGWTFIETLIVIGIILILSGTVGVMAFRFFDKAKEASARTQIENLTLALSSYLFDCRQYPSQQQGLEALWQKPVLEPVPARWDGPYVDKPIKADPWGQPYEYSAPGPNGLPFGIRSFGADGQEGGEGAERDIVSWE